MKKAFWIVVSTIGVIGILVSGCELVVDFDRSKIPQDGVDATTQDVTQPPLTDSSVVTDGASDAAKDGGTSTDAASDTGATDAGSDAAADASDDAGDGA